MSTEISKKKTSKINHPERIIPGISGVVPVDNRGESPVEI